jgi:predicted flap endonuclease-1-like 5' DNA nuclease
MNASFASALPFIIIGLVLLLIVVLLVWRANRKTTITGAEDSSIKQDVLDEGSAPARRNEALISAPRAPEIDFGETSAKANSHHTATAGESADAEAGVSVAPTVGDPVPGPPPTSAPPVAPEAEPAEGEELSRIKGVGPKLVTMLNNLGITSLSQIAAWDEAEIDRVDSQLGRFKGRIRRDQWVEQAKLLSSGDKDGFEAKFGRGA